MFNNSWTPTWPGEQVGHWVPGHQERAQSDLLTPPPSGPLDTPDDKAGKGESPYFLLALSQA